MVVLEEHTLGCELGEVGHEVGADLGWLKTIEGGDEDG